MFVLFLCWACSSEKVVDPVSLPENALDWDLFSDGPNAVGYKLINASISLPSGVSKSVPINLWYPTEDTNDEPAHYLGFQEDEMVHLDSEPSLNLSPAPVLVYSHGKYLFGGSAAYLMRRFASHGWVVAAPDHIDNTVGNYGDPVGLEMYVQRPLSNFAAIDAVASEFGDAVNVERVLLSGFSFGAFDNWLSVGALIQETELQSQCLNGGFDGECDEVNQNAILNGLKDDRIAGIIPMAGSNKSDLFGQTGLSNLGLPIFQISGSEDTDQPQAFFDLAADNDLRWLDINGGCHALFSAGGCVDIDRETGWNMVSAYSLAFGRLLLMNDSTDETLGMLSGDTAPWSETIIKSP